MGDHPPNSTDRRVLRTRRTLRDALIALLLDHSWEDISVQDICGRADVGRSTFYLHFSDKEELLVGGFEDLGRAIRAQLATLAPEPRTPLPFARGLIQHALDNRRLFRALVGRRTGQVVVRRFHDLTLGLVTEDLAASCAPSATRDAAARFLAGGFLELLGGALESRTEPSVDELDRWFQAMAGSALAMVRGSG